MKWPSVSLRPWSTTTGSEAGPVASGSATDAELNDLPDYEARALEELRHEVLGLFGDDCEKLSENDGWQMFNAKKASAYDVTKRDEMLLRVLRYNLLNVSKAGLQIRRTFEWRAIENVSMKPLDVLNGATIGLPAAKVTFCEKKDEIVVICITEAYVRREVDHEKQTLGFTKLLDHFFYDKQGPRAKRVTAVADFTNLSAKNVDLIAMKNGISVYMNHFPDIFHKIFLMNYPRFIHGGKFFIFIFICCFLKTSVFSGAKTKNRALYL